MRKRVLTLCMVLAMCLSLLPSPVLAAEADPAPTAEQTLKTPDFAAPAEESADVADAIRAELFGSAWDEGDLLMYYLEQEAGVLPEATLMAEAGDRLTGLEKAIYNALIPMIKKIAAGIQQSTQITLDLKALGYSQTQSISRESYDRVLFCLLADCPYDFYWFGNVYTYPVVANSLMTCKFYVSQYYAAGDFQVRSDLGALLSAVQTNTNGIVNKHAGKGDYEKLKAYKDEICERVDYDYVAAASGSSKNNSNPYQLLFVFDNDKSTKVVCEGYAKAFQFLCDLSSFKDSAFACYHVQGWFSTDGTTNTGGRHSWNHVTLNGKTYLIDATHCDKDDGTYDDSRFMRPALSGYNTPATGYAVYLTNSTVKVWYLDIDFYQFARDHNQSNENYYDKDAPFLTLATTPYERPKYKVTVIDGTGSGNYEEGQTVTVSQNSAPDGCKIWGWRRPSAITLTFSGNQATFVMPAYAVTLNALYSYVVTLEPNGGSLPDGAAKSMELLFTRDKSYVKTYGDGGALPVPVRDGYTFNGWYTAKTDGVKVTEDATPSTLSNHTIYAHWTSVTPSKLKYKAAIIDGTGSGDYEEGETVAISANAAPAGCVLWGWRGPKLDSFAYVKDSPTKQASFKMPAYDVTLHALYGYTVTFDPNGGSLPDGAAKSMDLLFTRDKSYVKTYGDGGALPVPVRDGYTFNGWYTAKTDGVKVTEDTAPSTLSNHALYARWTPVYSLSFSPESVTVEEGASQTVVVTFTNKEFEYFNHNVTSDNKIISASWDSNSKTSNSISLIIKGLSAGKETVKISLLDSERNSLYAKSFDVTVTKKSSSGTKIVMEDKSAFRGTTVELPVMIQNNPGISGAVLTVSYDQSALTLNSVKKGSVFEKGTFTPYAETGVVMWYHTENITANGTLFTLQFTVNQAAENEKYPVIVELRDGKAANLTNADSKNVSAEFLPGTLEVISGVRGDVTGDNDVAINDVVKVARAVARKITLTEIEKTLADVTGDGVIAINDVVKLARYVAGNIASLQSAETASLSDGTPAVIETATVSAKPGAVVRVPVSVTSNPGIAGAQLDILFDDGLTLKDIVPGDILSVGAFEPDVSDKGVQWYYNQANVTGTGVLFTLEFEVSATAKNGDTYAVTVNVTDGITANLSDYDSNPVSAEFKPGKVQITETASDTIINTVSRSESAVTASVTCADTAATVFCGAYNNSGKMIAVRSAQVTGDSGYSFRFDGQTFDYAKVFVMDSRFRPLCEGKSA